MQRREGPRRGAVRCAVRWALRLGEDPRARWEALYTELTDGAGDGPLGALTQRGAPLVLRLATIYAVTDGRAALDVGDLDAALAVWRYSVASTLRAFGDRLLTPRARRLLSAITAAGAGGLARSAWRDALGSNAYDAATLDATGAELAACDLVFPIIEATATKPRTVWRAVAFRDVHVRRNRLNSDEPTLDEGATAYWA